MILFFHGQLPPEIGILPKHFVKQHVQFSAISISSMMGCIEQLAQSFAHPYNFFRLTCFLEHIDPY